VDAPEVPAPVLEEAGSVIAFARYRSEALEHHANVVFPAEIYAEKEGTVTHPDGRIQRLRTAIAKPGEVRSAWWVLAELAKRLGLDLAVLTGAMATRQVAAAVPFYAGLTLVEIGGWGVRWQERDAASAFTAPEPAAEAAYAEAATPNGSLRLGTFRSIWAAPAVRVSPALKFLHPRQRAELSPADAQRLGLQHGDKVVVGSNGHSVNAVVALRDAAPAGSVFLEEGIPTDAANVLDGPLVEVRKA
jgi:NADH-quinone oxidoreductase subunit G